MSRISDAWNKALNRGLTAFKRISTASTNATVIKAEPGRFLGYYVSNTNAAARYVKFYDKATAPTVGTDTPLLSYMVPGATTGGGASQNFVPGVRFSAGISMATTTGAADADTGAVAANEVIVNVVYS